MTEAGLRNMMAMHGKSLFERGYAAGGSGNLSLRLEDGFLLTPTNASLGRLIPSRISKLGRQGNPLAGDKPSKECALHLAVYRARPQDGAVVHLHSTAAVAVSCLRGLDPDSVLPSLTPYFVMKIGRLPLLGYYPPGDPGLAAAVGEALQARRAVLLAHHGTVVAGKDLDDAVQAAEEIEETARLFLLLGDRGHRVLDARQIAELGEISKKS